MENDFQNLSTRSVVESNVKTPTERQLVAQHKKPHVIFIHESASLSTLFTISQYVLTVSTFDYICIEVYLPFLMIAMICYLAIPVQ